MRPIITPAAALVLLAAAPGVAAAHAFLKAADPAVGSTVTASPSQVAIDFTEAVEPAFSRIVVQDASGADVESGKAHLVAGQSARLAVDLKALQPGTYKVVWHVTASDTHKTQGSFSFTVAP